MPIGSYIAVYFVVWWMCLFMVLPVGARSQIQDGAVVPGTEPGAPTTARLGRTIVWTTLLAAVVTASLLWVLQADWLHQYLR